MITDKTSEILLCIYSFSGAGGLQQVLDGACRALAAYCQAQDVQAWVVE